MQKFTNDVYWDEDSVRSGDGSPFRKGILDLILGGDKRPILLNGTNVKSLDVAQVEKARYLPVTNCRVHVKQMRVFCIVTVQSDRDYTE